MNTLKHCVNGNLVKLQIYTDPKRKLCSCLQELWTSVKIRKSGPQPIPKIKKGLPRPRALVWDSYTGWNSQFIK